MPAEIALLPFIESAFVTKAKSRRRIRPVAIYAGYWPPLRLGKTPLYDGRHDVYAATDAALNYLQYLHGMFGDWSLSCRLQLGRR